MLAKLGDGGYDLGARARQIRDDLMRLEQATPARPARDPARRPRPLPGALARSAAADPEPGRPSPGHPRAARAAPAGGDRLDGAAPRSVRRATGRCACSASLLDEQVFVALSGQGNVPEETRFEPPSQFEGPLWRLVTERPPTCSIPLQELGRAAPRRRGPGGEGRRTLGPQLADRTWGERNTTPIQHPLSLARAGPRPLARRAARGRSPGTHNMPRVQGPNFGASERMVVSPGHEETGLFHMPGGRERQSPLAVLSEGGGGLGGGGADAVPPGPAVHRLRLVPAH